jgi:hypothetical protein
MAVVVEVLEHGMLQSFASFREGFTADVGKALADGPLLREPNRNRTEMTTEACGAE